MSTTVPNLGAPMAQPTKEFCTFSQLRELLHSRIGYDNSDINLTNCIEASGPPHDPTFKVTVFIHSKEHGALRSTFGKASNKKEALTLASTVMFSQLDDVCKEIASYEVPKPPKPLQEVVQQMKEVEEAMAVKRAAQQAHLDILQAIDDQLREVVSAMRASSIPYATIVTVACAVLRGTRKAEADAHNALMHALNGNGLRIRLHSVIDKTLDDMQGATPEARKNAVVRAVQSTFGGSPKSKTVRKPRQGEAKKRNNMQRAKNGNIQDVRVRAVEAAAHNSRMHALNGNGEVAQIITENTSGREHPDYETALTQYKKDCAHDGLTGQANAQLLQMLDPCADVPRDEKDFPDGDMDWSLKARWVSEIAITPPIGSSTNWSFMVCTDPFSGVRGSMAPGFPTSVAYSDPGWRQARAGNLMYSAPGGFATADYTPFGGEPVIFSRTLDGTNHWRTGQESRDIGCVPIPNQYSSQPFRVSGIGIEVINTTAPLNKQGMVTAFNYPARRVDTLEAYNTLWNAGVTVLGASDLNTLGTSTTQINTITAANAIGVARPPYNQTEAANSKGSKSWSASNGYYAPAVFESIPDIGPPVPACPYWYDTTIPEGGQVGPVPNIVGCMPGRIVPSNGVQAVNRLISTTESSGNTAVAATSAPFTWDGLTPYVRYIPVSRKGCIFTGLSPQTTLTLRVVYYITRVPQVNQIDLYALSKKPANYDPYFWDAYKKAVEQMPVGVPFTENPLGEWFNTVTKMLAKAAPIVGQLVPGAGPLALAVGQAAKMANHWNRGKQEKPKNKQKQMDDNYVGRRYGY